MLRKKTQEKFIEEVFNLVGKEYEVLGFYNGNRVKVLMKHNICGHEFLMWPEKFLSGSRCPNCYKNKKKTIESYKKEVLDRFNGEYEILGDVYTNNKTKILTKHVKCGHEWEINPHDLLSPRGCPICRNNGGLPERSKIVVLFETFLEENNIKFERQKRVKIENINLLIDYYFPELNLFLEIDGRQHFLEGKIDSIHNINFRDGAKRDWMKNQYCIDNKINLLRFVYINNHMKKDILNESFEKLKNVMLLDENALKIIKENFYYYYYIDKDGEETLLNKTEYYENQNKEYFNRLNKK